MRWSPRSSGRWPARVPRVVATLAVALLGGAALWLLTLALSKSDVGGDGWSLRGNGALIVPALGLPLLLLIGEWRVLRSGGSGWARLAAALALPIVLLAGLILASRAMPE
jgi:hypothetical protein